MMKFIVFIFVNVYFAMCKTMPKSLDCIDVNCQETISTARLNRATSPLYGTLKNIKISSKILIKGKNNDKKNTLWLIEQEGLYGFIDLSFVKEIKNSVRSDLLNVKNPYYTEVIDEFPDKDDVRKESGLFSSKQSKFETENNIDNETGISEENDDINKDEENTTQVISNKSEMQNIRGVDSVNDSERNDYQLNESSILPKSDLKIENEDHIKVKQETGLENEISQLIKNNLGDNENKLAKEKASNKMENQNIVKNNIQYDTDEPIKLLEDSDLKSKISITKEPLNRQVQNSDSEDVLTKSHNETVYKNPDSLKIAHKDELNTKNIERNIEDNIRKNTENTFNNQINHSDIINKSIELDNKSSIAKNSINHDITKSQYEVKSAMEIDKKEQKSVKENYNLNISEYKEPEQAATNQNMEDEKISVYNMLKEKSQPVNLHPETNTDETNKDEKFPELIKEELKNSPKIEEPQISSQSESEVKLDKKENEYFEIKNQAKNKENSFLPDDKIQSSSTGLYKETKGSVDQNSEIRKTINEKEKNILINTSLKETESSKTNPSNIANENDSVKSKFVPNEKMKTEYLEVINEDPKESLQNHEIDDVNHSRTDIENKGPAVNLKINDRIKELKKTINNHDKHALGESKNHEKNGKEFRDSEDSDNKDPWLESNSDPQIPSSIKSPLIRLAIKFDSFIQRLILHVLSRLGIDSSCTVAKFSQSWLHMSLESLLSVIGFLSVLGLITYSPIILRFHRDWHVEFIRQARVVSELQEKLDTIEETRQKLSVQNHQFERVVNGHKQQIVEIQQDAASAKKAVLVELDKIKKSSELQIGTLKQDLASKTQQYKVLELEIERKLETIELLEQDAATRRYQFEDDLARKDASVNQLEKELSEMDRVNKELKRENLDQSREIEILQNTLESRHQELLEKSEEYRRLEKSFDSLRVFEGLDIEQLVEKKEEYLELTFCKEQLELAEKTCQQFQADICKSANMIEELGTALENAEKKRLEHDVDRLKAVALQEQAETKLKVLSDYFKSKEVEMARSLGHQVIESSQSQDQVDTLSHRIQLLEAENEEMAKTIKRFKLEIKEAQSFAAKCKLDANENSHELMFKINNLERNLLAERDTSKQLRAKLSHYVGPTPPRGTSTNHSKDRPSSRQSTNSGGGAGGNSNSSGINNFVSLPPQLVPISFLPQSTSSTSMQHSPFSGRNSVASKKSNNT